MPPEPKKPEPDSRPDRSERDEFARFAKKLVNVPKKEIDERARKWRERRES
jgi:hypothetical protein